MATKTPHTPGPWEIFESHPCDMGGSICSGFVKIGTVVGGFGRKKTKRGVANARLIVAAPELLEGCKTALRILKGLEIDWSTLTDDQHGKFPGASAIKILENVIAKATGAA